MSKAAMVLWVLSVCWFMSFCSRATVPPYRGLVMDKSTGNPVRGAAVLNKVEFPCRQLRLTDGNERSLPGPLRETRTDTDGVFKILSPGITVPPGCRFRSHTTVWAPGYFPAVITGEPTKIYLQPMTHYLDYLPWRYPREHFPQAVGKLDADLTRRCHRRIRRFQGARGLADLEHESPLISQLRAALNSRPLVPRGKAGVFRRLSGAGFDRIKRLTREEGFLLHCSKSRSWRRISTRGYPLHTMPSIPGGAAILPDSLPMDRGFVFVRSGRVHIPRNPAASAAPFTADRYLSVPCRHPEVTAVEPWGNGAVTVEGSGRYVSFYGRENGSLKVLWEVSAPAIHEDSGKSEFTRLLTATVHVLALVGDGDCVGVLTLPDPGTGPETGRPVRLPVTGTFTAAAWQDGLVLGFADGGLRRWTIQSRPSPGKILMDRAFETFTHGILPGPVTGLAAGPDHHVLAVCQGGEVYRFGILGIPDQAVRLGESAGSSGTIEAGNPGPSPGELKTSPPRIHPRAGRAKTRADKKEKPRVRP